jgi:hypothetical protein
MNIDKTLKVFVIIILIWWIFFTGITYTYTSKTYTYCWKWNGLVWVALDYYLIVKYRSLDKPMRVIEYSKIPNNIDKIKN